MNLSINLYFDSKERFFPIDLNQRLRNYISNTTINSYTRVIDKNTTWVYYFMYYLFDDGLGSCHVDSHVDDLELVIVEIKNDSTISRICFTPHSQKEHFWLNEADSQTCLEKTNYGFAINIYCSLGKHATYPIGGKIHRDLGFANDTNDAKNKIVPRICELTPETINHPYFAGKKPLLSGELDYPVVELKKVKYHMFFRGLPDMSNIFNCY